MVLYRLSHSRRSGVFNCAWSPFYSILRLAVCSITIIGCAYFVYSLSDNSKALHIKIFLVSVCLGFIVACAIDSQRVGAVASLIPSGTDNFRPARFVATCVLDAMCAVLTVRASGSVFLFKYLNIDLQLHRNQQPMYSSIMLVAIKGPKNFSREPCLCP